MEQKELKPFTLQWHITHRCNLRCSHCYQDDYSAFTSREAVEDVLRQYEELLRANGFRGFLNITGGEPLLHPELFPLLEQAQRLGMVTAVLTNGTLIGEKEAKTLKRLGVDYVQVSLDGTEKTHDAIRGKNSFSDAVRGICALREQGIFTTVSFTAQRQNCRELKKLARYCGRLGVGKLWFDRVVIPEGEDGQSLRLSKEEFQRLCKTAAGLNKSKQVSCARALQFLPCETKRIYRCTAGISLLALLADGTVMPCRRLPIKAGSLSESSLAEIYRDSPLLRELRAADIPKACGACEYKESCRGGARCQAYAKTGDWSKADPDCFFEAES